MSHRAALWLTRAAYAVATLMIVVAGFTAFTSFDRVAPGQVVVIPAGQTARIQEAARSMGEDCHGDITDAELADGPSVYCDLSQRVAAGDALSPDRVDPLSLVMILIGLLWLTTGGLIASRQPRNLAGWIFQLVGLGLMATPFAVSLVVRGAKVEPGSVPFLAVWGLIGEYAFSSIGLLPMLWLLFPDGRPPTNRWRWASRTYVGALALAVAASLFSPGPLNNFVDIGVVYMNPLGVPALATISGVLTGVGVTIVLVIALATVLGVRGRFKRAQGEERQQLRWLRFVTTVAGSLFAVGFGGSIVSTLFEGSSDSARVDWAFGAFFALLALTIGLGIPGAYLIAIFRHGLWDLDVVIKKTVQYAVLFTAMMLVTVAIAIAVPIVLVGAGSGTDFLPIVLLAALLSVAFTWIRGPARRLADRMVYGKRATPYEVLSAFSERVGETYAAEDVLERMAAVLGEGTGAERATVWLLVGTDLRPEAVWPTEAQVPSVPPEDAVEVTHQGEILGALSVDMPANDPMNPARQSLIADLAGQAGLVLRNVRLIEELRASRKRLVAAQDDERRKLERNIHDGAQQQLVALSVQLRLLEALIERDPAAAKRAASDLQTAAAETIDDLRDLARGIYPPLLADKGLAAALEAQARKAVVPTTVTADGVDRLGQDAEATVYFCTLEALNNVAKYAEASRASVHLSQTNGSLSFTVTDDGKGFDTDRTTHGSGLQGMADRLDAIGGLLSVTSTHGEGTTIAGSIPVERADD